MMMRRKESYLHTLNWMSLIKLFIKRMIFFLLRNTKHMLGSKQHWTSLTVMSLTKRNWDVFHNILFVVHRRKSNTFGTTWGWLNNDFSVIYPLKSVSAGSHPPFKDANAVAFKPSLKVFLTDAVSPWVPLRHVYTVSFPLSSSSDCSGLVDPAGLVDNDRPWQTVMRWCIQTPVISMYLSMIRTYSWLLFLLRKACHSVGLILCLHACWVGWHYT